MIFFVLIVEIVSWHLVINCFFYQNKAGIIMEIVLEIPRKKWISYQTEVWSKGDRSLRRTFKRKTDVQHLINDQELIIYKGGVVTMKVDRKSEGD